MLDREGDFALALVEARFLKGLELRDIFFAMIAEATFLECEIAEISPVVDSDAGAEESGAGGGVFLSGEFAGEFAQSEAQDGSFEWGDAQETPFGVDDGLDESVFVVSSGSVFGEVTVNVLLVSEGVVSGKKNGLAGESGFDGVMGGDGLALSGDRSGAFLSRPPQNR